jgi:hypothetical protein
MVHKNRTGRDLCNLGEAIVTIVSPDSDDGKTIPHIHLLRWDRFGAVLQVPPDLIDMQYDDTWIIQNTKRILASIEKIAKSAEFKDSPISKLAANEGSSPPEAGMPRYFGMGNWGLDVGLISIGT